MPKVNRIFIHLSIFAELISFFWRNKLWWMIPILTVVAIVMLFVFFGQTTGLAPFIYPLF